VLVSAAHAMLFQKKGYNLTMANKEIYQAFQEASEKKAFDKRHRSTIGYNIGCYDKAFARGLDFFTRPDIARQRAALKKHGVLEHLEDHLKSFEQHFTARGGKVIWAQDAEEARMAILDILQKQYVESVVKSKSMTTEEVGVTTFLQKNGIDCVETDLGEFIVQVSDDKPYHIVTPAMHLSAGDVAKIFHEKFDLPEDATPDQVAAFVRPHLREKFRRAGASITGSNFLVSRTGSVALTENEGNALFCVSAPKIHIAIAGIEKVIPAIEDLDLFWPLLAVHGTGQDMSAYNTLVSGPKAAGEEDGPDQMYVILLDNGRSRLLSTIPQRRALSCIRCGACLNVCPVYKNIGGHSYGTVYSGPIGSVISPHLSGQLKEYIHLSYASSLCGKCTEVCPAGIDLHHQLLQNRRLAVRSAFPPRTERWGIKAYKMTMSKASRLDKAPPGVKNLFARIFFSRAWGPRRTLPKVVEGFRKKWVNNG